MGPQAGNVDSQGLEGLEGVCVEIVGAGEGVLNGGLETTRQGVPRGAEVCAARGVRQCRYRGVVYGEEERLLGWRHESRAVASGVRECEQRCRCRWPV